MKTAFRENGCLIFAIFLMAHPEVAHTQNEQALPEVTISGQPAWGFSPWTADSLPTELPFSLADRLTWENPLAIRTNAPGTLTTISARGAGPNRTAVVWNGLNLQSPQNGVVDVALVPLWSHDQVRLVPGGQSATWGSGAMGGVLMLESAVRSDTGLSAGIGTAVGSFDRYELNLCAGFGNKKVRSSIQAYGQMAENDFPFVNTAQIGQPEQKQVNNRAERFDIQQMNDWQLSAGARLKTALWFQRATREIPPPTTSSPTETWQEDRNLRAVADLSSGAHWLHRLAWSDEQIRFFLYGDTDTSRARTAMWLSRYETEVGRKWQLSAEAQITPQWAQADGYADSSRWYSQVRGALAPTLRFRWKSGRASLGLRQEWNDIAHVPLLYTMGFEQSMAKKWLAHGHFSRNYNLPTFNDRFWSTLKNQEDLRAEDGHSAEIGVRWAGSSLKTGLTAFHLLLDDWILWQPGTDGVFRPGNLRQVWSRGLEFAVNWSGSLGEKCTFHINGHYQYAATTHTKVYGGSENVLYKQLIYTPNHLAGANLSVSSGRFSMAYLQQYSGPRYVRSDESRRLDSYTTGQLLAQYRFVLRNTGISMEGRVENIWNAAYQVLEYRPMPGRSWRLGASIQF